LEGTSWLRWGKQGKKRKLGMTAWLSLALNVAQRAFVLDVYDLIPANVMCRSPTDWLLVMHGERRRFSNRLLRDARLWHDCCSSRWQLKIYYCHYYCYCYYLWCVGGEVVVTSCHVGVCGHLSNWAVHAGLMLVLVFDR
jgi:hypothetical protein